MKNNKITNEIKKSKIFIAVVTIAAILIMFTIASIIIRYNNKNKTNVPVESSEEIIETSSSTEKSSEEILVVEEVDLREKLFGAWVSDDKLDLLIVAGTVEETSIRIINMSFRDYYVTGHIDDNCIETDEGWKVYYKYDEEKDELNIMYNAVSEEDWNEEHSYASKPLLKRTNTDEVYAIAENYEFPAIERVEDPELTFVNENIKKEVQFEELKETVKINENVEKIIEYINSGLEYQPVMCGVSDDNNQVEVIERLLNNVLHMTIVNNDSEKLQKEYENAIEFIKNAYGFYEESEDVVKEHYTYKLIMTKYGENIVLKTDNSVIYCYGEVHVVNGDLQTTPYDIMVNIIKQLEEVQ